MNSKIALIVVFLVLFSFGCSAVDEQNPDGEGYVYEISEDRVLILDNIDLSDTGKEWIDIYETYQGNAIWLSTRKYNLKVGQYVQYWIDGGINDSYPQQASAKKDRSNEKIE